jgi:hypothetical protein
MRRHSKEGREPLKALRRKTITRKSRNSPKAKGRPLAGARQTALARAVRERDEALEQQAAISDILRVISNSPGDVQPVLDTVAERGAHICEARVVDILIVDKEVLRAVASFGEAGRLSSGESAPLDRSSVTGRSICDMQPVHIADLQHAGDEFPLGRELAIRFGDRTILSVPLIREGRALGAIVVRRTEVRPFEEKHIALLKAFADQAAIAIENVRLFKVEQQRTRELSESLEQQTATSEILRVISATVPSTPALRRQEIKLQAALVTVLLHVKGYTASETKAAAERGLLLIKQAEAIGEPVDDALQLFSVLYGLWGASLTASKGDVGRELAMQFLELAEKHAATAPLMIGHRVMGVSLMTAGDIAAGRAQLDKAIALYDPPVHRPLAVQFGIDPGVTALSFRGRALWLLGYPEAALVDAHHALKDAREIGHVVTLMIALWQYRPPIHSAGTDQASAFAR